MTIEVKLHGSRTPIERDVFVDLFENSVVHSYRPFIDALEKSEISFSDLVDLARKADIPYPLFFAPHALVQSQLAMKTTKLLQGVTKETFSLNTRTTVEIRDVELILKDLLRKQMLLRKSDDSLKDNEVAGILRVPSGSAVEDARILLSALGLDSMSIRNVRTKRMALALLIDHLESHQVLVSQSVQGFMPQRLQVKFSGMAVKDPKVPYIFLARGGDGDAQEPEGRQLFTLTLLAVLVARGIFAAVTYDGRSDAAEAGREYEIVGEILMPAADMSGMDLSTLEAIKDAADLFKVTPSAVIVRAMRLKQISAIDGRPFLQSLEAEFAARPKPQGRTPLAVNGVRTYNGREFSSRMLGAYDAGKLSAGDFCRAVCGNKIKPLDIPAFRQAVA